MALHLYLSRDLHLYLSNSLSLLESREGISFTIWDTLLAVMLVISYDSYDVRHWGFVECRGVPRPGTWHRFVYCPGTCVQKRSNQVQTAFLFDQRHPICPNNLNYITPATIACWNDHAYLRLDVSIFEFLRIALVWESHRIGEKVWDDCQTQIVRAMTVVWTVDEKANLITSMPLQTRATIAYSRKRGLLAYWPSRSWLSRHHCHRSLDVYLCSNKWGPACISLCYEVIIEDVWFDWEESYKITKNCWAVRWCEKGKATIVVKTNIDLIGKRRKRKPSWVARALRGKACLRHIEWDLVIVITLSLIM